MDVEREQAHRVAADKLAQDLKQQIRALQTEEEQAAAALKHEFSSHKVEVGLPFPFPFPFPFPLPFPLLSLTCNLGYFSASPCPFGSYTPPLVLAPVHPRLGSGLYALHAACLQGVTSMSLSTIALLLMSTKLQHNDFSLSCQLTLDCIV